MSLKRIEIGFFKRIGFFKQPGKQTTTGCSPHGTEWSARSIQLDEELKNNTAVETRTIITCGQEVKGVSKIRSTKKT